MEQQRIKDYHILTNLTQYNDPNLTRIISKGTPSTIFSYIINTQVDDSGQRIPRDPAGKHRKSLEHGSSIPTGNCPDFFGWIPVNFL